MKCFNFYLLCFFMLSFSVASHAGGPSTNVHNECSNAASITVSTEKTCSPTIFTFEGASTTKSPNCTFDVPRGDDPITQLSEDIFSGSSPVDIWVKAVVPASGNLMIEAFNPDAIEDLVGSINTLGISIEAFRSSSNDCSSLERLFCIDGDVVSVGLPIPFSSQAISGATPGETLYFKISRTTFDVLLTEAPTIDLNKVSICIYDLGEVTNYTTNDDCTFAPEITLDPSTDNTCKVYAAAFSGAIAFLSDDNVSTTSLCFFSRPNAIFKATVPSSGNLTFTTCGTFPQNRFGQDVIVQVVSGNPCMGSMPTLTESNTIIGCQNLDNGDGDKQEKVELTGRTPGETIYFLVGFASPAVVVGPPPSTLVDKEVPTTASSASTEPVLLFNVIGASLETTTTVPDIFENPEEVFASQNEITFGDPCSCDDPRNCTTGGVQYFHDTLTIPATLATTAGLNIQVSSATNFFVDVPCFGTALTNATNEVIPEVSPGVYKIEFWRPSGVIPTLSVTVNSGTPVTAPASTFQPVCTTEACTPAPPIPTMSEWGLLIFGLVVVNLGLVFVRRREHLTF